MEWVGNHIEIDPPKRTKKLTGTRFATVLGLNPWSTPFEIWCEVTKTYQKPFEGTIFTEAGKTIEPKQAEYMKKSYFMSSLVTPTDVWGEDYFKKTWGDFFPETKVLGGMWDYLNTDKQGNTTAVLEMKTSKRVEDWKDDIPEYYALQAALYAYLLKTDQVIMVASFLEDAYYEHPENFVPSAKNTIVRPFKVSERYPNFYKTHVLPALNWWKKYVESGISPDYDEKKDAEILKELRKKVVDTTAEDAEDLMAEAEALKDEIDAATAAIADKEKRLKAITDAWKKESIATLEQDTGYKQVSNAGRKWDWVVTRSEKMTLDTDAMKADGIYEKYLKPTTSYTMRVTKI